MTHTTTMHGQIAKRVEVTARRVQKAAELTTQHVTLDNVRKLEAEAVALNDLLEHYAMMRSFGLLDEPGVTAPVPVPAPATYLPAYS